MRDKSAQEALEVAHKCSARLSSEWYVGDFVPHGNAISICARHTECLLCAQY